MTDTQDTEELKPCPFCGRPLLFDQAHEIWWHGTDGASCIGMAIQLNADDAEAIAAWNHRPDSPVTVIQRALLDRHIQRCRDAVAECSNWSPAQAEWSRARDALLNYRDDLAKLSQGSVDDE